MPTNEEVAEAKRSADLAEARAREAEARANEAKTQTKIKIPPLQVFGTCLGILGYAFSGLFVIRQIRESGSGSTYYGFIIFGIILALIGIVIKVAVRRNRCSISNEHSRRA